MLRVDGRSLQLRELIIGEGQDLEEVARVTGVAAPAATPGTVAVATAAAYTAGL